MGGSGQLAASIPGRRIVGQADLGLYIVVSLGGNIVTDLEAPIICQSAGGLSRERPRTRGQEYGTLVLGGRRTVRGR